MAQIVIEVPGTKISELEKTTSVSRDDVTPVVQDGETKQTEIGQIVDLVKSELGSASTKDTEDFATPQSVSDVALQSQQRDNAQNERIDEIEFKATVAQSGFEASFNSYAAMLAYTPSKANVSVRVNNDTDTTKIGTYTWTGTEYKKGTDLLTLANQHAETYTNDIFNNSVVNNILTPARIKNITSGNRINKAIKSLALRGDFNGKLITLAAMSYVNGVFTIQLARPASKDEVMSATSNTKFVARFSSELTFSGVQTLTLSTMANDISGEIVIDFTELLTSDLLAANYVASDRLFDNRAIINLNAEYNKIKSIDTNILDTNARVTRAKGIVFTDDINATNALSTRVNKAIKSLALRGDFNGKLITLAAMSYVNGVFTIQLARPASKDEAMSATSNTKFVARFSSELTFSGVQTLTLSTMANDISGEIVIDFAELLTSDQLFANYTASDRLFDNRAIINLNAEYNKVKSIDANILDTNARVTRAKGIVFTDDVNVTSSLNTRINKAIKSLSLRGEYIGKLITLASMSYVNGSFAIQLARPASKDEAMSGATNTKFVARFVGPLTFAGVQTLTLSPYGNVSAGISGEIVIDFGELVTSDLLTATYTAYERLFDSRAIINLNAGVVKYFSLKHALDAKEKGLFAVGGNLFKSSKEVPTSKDDLLCINNRPKFLAKKPRVREYDFYYKNAKIRLDIIDSEDAFYFVNTDVIIKAPHPLKQTLTPVSAKNSTDFVLFDVKANAYFSISNFTELFTKTALNVTAINFVRLTYDDELFIIAAAPNRTILITENAQTSLRTFTINGSTGNKYSFGEGVTLVKDWCMAHYKNVMFVCDYDTGVNGIRGTTGGQKCYVSTDNGYTFTKCLDFSGTDWSNVINASAITSFNRDSAHIHAVTYDPKQGVVWVVTGDGATYLDNASFFYSRDLGQTWTQMRSTAVDNNAKTQMIQALPFDNCVAFGSDDSSINGVTVITYDGDRMTNEIAKNFISKQTLLAFARGSWTSNFNDLKFISFGKDVQQVADPEAKSFVVASSNGYTWDIVWEDKAQDIYGNVFVYDDSKGKIFISLDGSTEKTSRVVVLDAKFM